VPRAIAHAVAIATTAAWSFVGAKNPPPLVHSSFHLIGEEVTVNDAKARRDLGYSPVVAREEGLREMQAQRAVA
jgi:hypothetical protein